MSTKRSAGTGVPTQGTRRSAATRKVGRLTATKKKARSTNLCVFTFADGRQCRTPRCSAHSYLCYFHAQKEAQSLAAQQVGEDISRFLPAKLLTACDLGVAMSRLFCAVAQGQVKPKVASTLAYLAQTMLQSVAIAQDEFIHSFDTNAWRREVRSTFHVPAPPPAPAPHPASQPAPQPPSSASAPTTAPPSTAPPQPPANCHSERSDERPTSGASPESYREESAFSSSPVPSQTPASVSPPSPVCHPERSAPSALRTNLRSEGSSSSNSSLATHHLPLPPASSPHTPLPPTCAEFFQQVVAGLQTGSSDSSSSSTPSPAPQPPVNCHSERSALSALRTNLRSKEPASSVSSSSSSSNSSLGTHHSPRPQAPQPAPATPAPPPVPPGFGAPANWDVLIPPKPRRRFSRHWQFLG